jgi:hypothetical protein
MAIGNDHFFGFYAIDNGPAVYSSFGNDRSELYRLVGFDYINELSGLAALHGLRRNEHYILLDT